MTTSDDAFTHLQQELGKSYASDVRMANRSVIQGTGNPGFYGRSLFACGIKHAAVRRAIEPALPLFEGSKLAFGLALKKPPKHRPEQTVQDTLNERFTDNFSYFASCELVAGHEAPSDTTSFAVAVAARAMAFTKPVMDEARQDRTGFDTSDFGSYLITFLSLLATARFWNVPIDFVDARVLAMPIPKSFEPLRKPLVELITGAGEDAEAIEKFRGGYAKIIHPEGYRQGCISDVLWDEAFTWSLVKERGRIVSAVVNLFDGI